MKNTVFYMQEKLGPRYFTANERYETFPEMPLAVKLQDQRENWRNTHVTNPSKFFEFSF